MVTNKRFLFMVNNRKKYYLQYKIQNVNTYFQRKHTGCIIYNLVPKSKYLCYIYTITLAIKTIIKNINATECLVCNK